MAEKFDLVVPKLGQIVNLEAPFQTVPWWDFGRTENIQASVEMQRKIVVE